MTSAKPDWDLLIVANEEDAENHAWFPADRYRTIHDFRALEGMRFRDVYLTPLAWELGGDILFGILNRTCQITGIGRVLHINDFEGDR